MATLARLASEQRPVPLEGLSPHALLASARTAIARGLLDDLDWLAQDAAAVAMFELASALPRCTEKREIGRRVLTALHQGAAGTFVAIATALALGSPRGVSGDQIRARVALSLQLPAGMGTRADALALALISRRELEREWVRTAATGSLPSRRLAARLIERAARQAARRAAEGDSTGIAVFQSDSVRTAWKWLLGDRESLVWRHIAAARGVLSYAIPSMWAEIDHDLSLALTPTEWRRAAASLAASLAVAPITSLERARDVLESPILERDPGVAGAMIFGLPFAAETELEAAEELLEIIVEVGDISAAELLASLRQERKDTTIGADAALLARRQLEQADATDDDGVAALREAIMDELRPAEERAEESIRNSLFGALDAFARTGAPGVAEELDKVLAAASKRIQILEDAGDDTPEARRASFRALRELSNALLETATLKDLWRVCNPNGTRSARKLADLFNRLTDWLIERESAPLVNNGNLHPTLRLHRMRALLHLVDADLPKTMETNFERRDRRLSALRVLLHRVRDDDPSPLRRITCAALARTCDALVRDEICELSDIVLAVAMFVHDEFDLDVLAQASMSPELAGSLRSYTVAFRAAQDGDEDLAGTLIELGHSLPIARSARVEALRGGILRVAHSLAAIVAARSLEDLVAGIGNRPLERLEDSVLWLAQLIAAADRRLDLDVAEADPESGIAIHSVSSSIDRELRGEERTVAVTVVDAMEIIGRELPAGVAGLVDQALQRVATLPAKTPEGEHLAVSTLQSGRTRLIAPWLPPSRTIGGFYVMGALGSGGGGSVFVACRAEERHADTPGRFALKVPEYTGAAARSLSEEEFLRMFREEAGALLALPQHTNLASFVTFDAGAKPKPILVMELVEGPSIDRLIDREELSMSDVLAMIHGVAMGLDAMHAGGVAHLDVKPSNVIMRNPPLTSRVPVTLTGESRPDPVLVDFGLAGRHIRPSCATVYYGAPEIWSAEHKAHQGPPMPADVYAFSCMVYELLTGELLFYGDTPIAIVTAHLSHDGNPPDLMALADHDQSLEPLVAVLRNGLRKDPDARPSIIELAEHLIEITPLLTRYKWPLGEATE